VCFYLAKNPKSKDWVKEKYNKQLEKFKRDCELIKRVAKDFNESGDDYVSPQQRPIGFDDNVTKLDRLKSGIRSTTI
jgi:spore coat polysaccharide biosynthesis protein SpsF (cytidylyltransferase family)